jgi:hypothetical protein
LQRLKRDFERWRSLKHPNIGELIGVALHLGNLPSFVVPLYQTVSEYVAENRSADVLHLVRIPLLYLKSPLNRFRIVTTQLEGVASALSFLHAQSPSLAYGDLKGVSSPLTILGTHLLNQNLFLILSQPSSSPRRVLRAFPTLGSRVSRSPPTGATTVSPACGGLRPK